MTNHNEPADSSTEREPDFQTATDRPAASSTAASSADLPAAAEPRGPAHWFRRRRTLTITGAATAGALVLGLSFAAGTAVGSSSVAEDTTTTTVVPALLPGRDRYPGWESGQGGTSTGGTQSPPVDATAEQMIGVVTIVSELDYGVGEAAGTGIVVTSDGTVLTNHHVIEGATSIEVTVESTGETYSASVVGYDESEDVAVLQLDGASGLDTVELDPSEELTLGESVTSIGNAEGTGDLVAAEGTITGLDETITAGDASGGDAERLTSLIEIDAYVVSGDSGGPLLDAEGDVIGLVTAASSGTASVTGYAIDIDVAIEVWEQVESGEETVTVEIGLPAFLGVLLSGAPSAPGVLIGGVVDGSPAASAGLVAGDSITAVDGVPVTSADELGAAIAAHEPGDPVEISYTDSTGAMNLVTVTLTEGPAA
ncbi:S1C family serine protease [Naasia sp. SYSU D00948]|uniref:S1C family serine protease n=1 Tax=Naasia sp. SYSU D00948 TaxID=2817379 RepID=UPI001B316F08|nr:trypsin-like peptidase domain-containing protein [Naasia sp. SYSU D00948]